MNEEDLQEGELETPTGEETPQPISLEDLANDPEFGPLFQDPEALKGELNKAKGFTQKTQALADERREIEAIRKDAEDFKELQAIFDDPAKRTQFLTEMAALGQTSAPGPSVNLDELTDQERALYDLLQSEKARSDRFEKLLEEVLPTARKAQESERVTAALAKAKETYGIEVSPADLAEAMKTLGTADPLHAAAHIAATRPSTPSKPTTVSAQGQRASVMEELSGSAGFNQLLEQGANKATGR